MACIPFFQLSRVGSALATEDTSLAQLNLIVEDDEWSEPLQASLYGTTGPLRSDIVFGLPLSFRANLAWTKYLAPAMGLLMLFYPGRASASSYVRLRPSGELEVEFAPEPPHAVERRLIRLLRKMGYVTHSALIQRPGSGAGLHYAGTLPMRDTPGALSNRFERPAVRHTARLHRGWRLLLPPAREEPDVHHHGQRPAHRPRARRGAAVRIFITAIGGFLGGALAGHLRGRGHEVAGSTRRAMELGRPFDTTVFERQDAVIHCAHDFTPGAHDANVAGTKAWMETAAALGVRQQIFLSSHAARADAAAEYGRTKHEIERLFLDRGYTVLRPGLVTGAGGLYARQRAALLRTRVVPMLGSGRQPVAAISIADFLAAATLVLEEERTGAFNLFYEPMPTYRQFVTGVREGKPRCFCRSPSDSRWR